MDLLVGCALELLGKYVLAPAASKIAERVLGTVSATKNGGYPQAITINLQNQYQEIPNESGIFLLPVPSGFDSIGEQSLTSGGFFLDDSLKYLLNSSDLYSKIVAMLIVDRDTDDVSLLYFDLNGYEIYIWPGNYLINAFIVDLNSDEMIGFGYPCLDDLVDLNPLVIPSGGELGINFIFFDIAYLDQFITD